MRSHDLPEVQAQNIRDRRSKDGVSNGRVRPFERSFNSFAENEENPRSKDGVPNGRMRPSKRSFHTIDQKKKKTE
jgi:hypothetical protein